MDSSWHCGTFGKLYNIKLHEKQFWKLDDNNRNQVTLIDRHELLTTPPTWKSKILLKILKIIIQNSREFKEKLRKIKSLLNQILGKLHDYIIEKYNYKKGKNYL